MICNNALAGILCWQNFDNNTSLYTNVVSHQNFLKSVIVRKEDIGPRIIGGSKVDRRDFSKFAYQVKNKL